MNILTDEEMSLMSGDSWRCEHCKAVLSVDEPFHTCSEGAKAARESNKKFKKDFFGSGTLKTRQFLVTIVAPDTDMGFSEAWDSMASWGPEETEGSDDILHYAWSIKEVK